MFVLGVPICTDSRAEILLQVRKFLNEPKFHRIATVNPEFLVLADNSPVFKVSLLAADLCVADGFGIVLAGFLQGKKISRLPGVDLLHELFAIAEQDGHSVFLAIKNDGLSRYSDVRAAVLKIYPRLQIDGMDIDIADCRLEIADSQVLNLKSKIINHKSRILLCNFGAPEQELFLESLRNNPGDVRFAMGIGGAFDFLTGKQKRAPKWLRIIGLEWLWRLILQPKRWRRIWTAVVVFPVKVLLRSSTPK